MCRRLSDPDYNLILNTPAIREARQECCHWHIRILPRMSYLSGFELGSEIYITTTYPEEAVQFLREGKDELFSKKGGKSYRRDNH